MWMIIANIISALYFIFPAYCANAAALIFGGGPPIDAGREFLDGRPILGLDARNLLEILLKSSNDAFLIPAHQSFGGLL